MQGVFFIPSVIACKVGEIMQIQPTVQSQRRVSEKLWFSQGFISLLQKGQRRQEEKRRLTGNDW